MKVLKVFLYILMLAVSCWTMLILAGPWMLKNYIDNKFSESIKLEKITITPRLEILIAGGIVRFAGNEELTFHGAKLNLQIEELNFVPNLTITQSEVVGRGSLHGLDIKLHLNNLSNDILILGSFDSFQGSNSIMINGADFSALSDWTFGHLREVDVNFKSIYGDIPLAFTAKSASLRLKEYTITNPSNDLALHGILLIEDLSMGDLSSAIQNTAIKISANEELLKFEFELENTVAHSEIVKIEKVIGEAQFDYVNERLRKPITLVTTGLAFKEIYVPETISKLQYNTQENSWELHTDGKLDASNWLITKNNAVTLPDSTFTSTAKINIEPGDFSYDGMIQGTIMAKSMSNPLTINANFVTPFSLSKLETDCPRLFCDLSGLNVTYFVETSRSGLSGQINCYSSDCEEEGEQHKVRLRNTNLLFEDFVDLKVVNPIVLGLIYLRVLEGTPMGDGHMISFQ